LRDNWAALEQFVQSMMDRFKIVGLAVGVSRGSATSYLKGFGLRNVTTKEPVTSHTVFGLASVSKSFTAMGIMQLVDAGLVSRDDAVVKHVPEFALRGVNDVSAVKIHHLLSHSSGLPPLKRRQGLKPFSEHLKYLAEADYELLGRPGEFFSYSNDAFIVLGCIIERVTGQPFTEYISQKIFAPVGLACSAYDDPTSLADVTELYEQHKASSGFRAHHWPDLGNYQVGGGIRANIEDLIAYTKLYTNAGVAKGQRIISEHAMRCMQQPVLQVSRNAFYGYALRITPSYGDFTLVEHGGALPGVSSHFGFVPEEKLGVVVLANTSAVPARAVWLATVNAALGLPLDQQSSAEPFWEPPAGFVERYVATYQSAEGGDLRIFMENGVLQGLIGAEQVELVPSDQRRLVYTANGQQAVLQFYARSNGEVWAVLAGSRMFRKQF